MAQYKVRGLYTISFEMTVEADSEEEAMWMGYDLPIHTEWNGQSVFVEDANCELNADGTVFDVEIEEVED